MNLFKRNSHDPSPLDRLMYYSLHTQVHTNAFFHMDHVSLLLAVRTSMEEPGQTVCAAIIGRLRDDD